MQPDEFLLFRKFAKVEPMLFGGDLIGECGCVRDAENDREKRNEGKFSCFKGAFRDTP
jgi:hypothetical protein